jgi:hypothetical protein
MNFWLIIARRANDRLRLVKITTADWFRVSRHRRANEGCVGKDLIFDAESTLYMAGFFRVKVFCNVTLFSLKVHFLLGWRRSSRPRGLPRRARRLIDPRYLHRACICFWSTFG